MTQLRAHEALPRFLEEIDQESLVLDIGSGGGEHATALEELGYIVHTVDFAKSIYWEKSKHSPTYVGDFNVVDIDPETYDAVWASHVLEHQRNTHDFLKKVYTVLKPGGVASITVPPLKTELVGGHLSLWTPGLLCYHMVLAGFDCSAARVGTYGYNISIVAKRPLQPILLPPLDYDFGDINRVSKYMPRGLNFERADVGLEFSHNWDLHSSR